MVRLYYGPSLFLSVFQHERQVVPQGFLSYTHSYLAFSSSLPLLLLFWILEFLSAHQHLSSQTLLSSLSISTFKTAFTKAASSSIDSCGWMVLELEMRNSGSNRIRV